MNTDKSEYLVGELAEYFGVSNDTLRLYDKKGICSPQKNETNHYRTYSREDFILLEFADPQGHGTGLQKKLRQGDRTFWPV